MDTLEVADADCWEFADPEEADLEFWEVALADVAAEVT